MSIIVDITTRRIENEPAYKKIQAILDALLEVLDDTDEEEEETKASRPEKQKEDKIVHPFTVTLDDPSGNSWMEFLQSMSDPKWNMRQYKRTKDQNAALGLAAPDTTTETTTEGTHPSTQPEEDNEEEVLVFPGVCSSCGVHLDTRMKKVTIPYFKANSLLFLHILCLTN